MKRVDEAERESYFKEPLISFVILMLNIFPTKAGRLRI